MDSRFSKVGSTSSLRITNIKEEDAGTYQCRAENREDSLDASATIQVQVSYLHMTQIMHLRDTVSYLICVCLPGCI